MWYRCMNCVAVFNEEMAKEKVADWGSGEKNCPFCGSENIEESEPDVEIHKL